MADLVEVKVPDIGDFADVPVIEVLVSAGDEVTLEDPLVTLESDKATMDIPAPRAGTVAEVKVVVGDTVSEGSLILLLAPVAADGATPDAAAPAADEAPVARRRLRRREPRRRRPTRTSACRSRCSAPGRAATRRPSAPPISVCRWR